MVEAGVGSIKVCIYISTHRPPTNVSTFTFSFVTANRDCPDHLFLDVFDFCSCKLCFNSIAARFEETRQTEQRKHRKRDI